MATVKQAEVEATAVRLGLAMSAEFVPFSQSRYAREKYPSLNWSVTLTHNGRPVLTTDYTAGCGHCPSYKSGARSVDEWGAVRRECETGRRAGSLVGKPILPAFADVLANLVGDASAIDFPTFEQWAEENGVDPDSRKAEAVYRKCLEHGLALRAAVGDAGLAELREALQDY